MKIECYNERNARSCNVRLTNLVETVNAAGINISLPQGTIKLNISPLITHLKFMLHGVQWIVKVTNRISLGNDLYNISYSIDWLKDYWLKYAENTGHYMIARTNNTEHINKFVPDDRFPFNGDFSRTITKGNSIGGITPVVVVAPTTEDSYTQVYQLSPAGFAEVQKHIFKNIEFNKALMATYFLPNVFGSIGTWNIALKLKYPTAVESSGGLDYRTHEISLEETVPPQLLGAKLSYNTPDAVLTFDTGLTIPKADWRDLYARKYAIYIPFVGMVNIDSTRINGRIYVDYYVDYVSGTIKAVLNEDKSTMTASNALPNMPIVSSAQAVAAVRSANITYNANQQRMVTDALIGAGQSAIGGAISAGGAGAAAGAVLGVGFGFLSAQINNDLNYNIAIKNAAIGALSTSSASAYEGLLYPSAYLVTITPGETINMAEHIAAAGAPSQEYIEHLSDLAPGYYWLDCSNALIYGGTDYESAYRQALHNVRINVN